MKTWRIKALAELTGVSVKTLHYYDKINLLSPTGRSPSHYRLYAEKDLFRLQQIVALKTFGLSLADIQVILAKSDDVMDVLTIQRDVLTKNAQKMLKTAELIDEIIVKHERHKSFDWSIMIKLIEEFQMTEHLKNAWVADVLEGQDLKNYAEFERKKEQNSTLEQRQAFGAKWKAIELAKRTMALIMPFYGRENRDLQYKIWNEGFKKGKADVDHGMSAQTAQWLDKAIDSYLLQQVHGILSTVESETDLGPKTAFLGLLEDICGNLASEIDKVYQRLYQDKSLNQTLHQWLKNVENGII